MSIKPKKSLSLETVLNIILILAGTIIIYRYSVKFSVIYVITFLILFFINVFIKNKKLETLEEIEKNVSEVFFINSEIVRYIPVSMIILDKNGKIIITNKRLEEKLNISEIEGQNINKISENISMDIFKKENGVEIIEIKEKVFEVRYKKSKNKKDEFILVLYLIDITKLFKKSLEIDDRKITVGLIYIDDYKDNGFQNKPYKLEIDTKVNILTDKLNGFAEKIDRDKYLILFEKRYLRVLEKDNFKFLEDIKEIGREDSMNITISFGIGKDGNDVRDVYSLAKTAIDISQGRGGDQAVIKSPENVEFYGGKTNAPEKKTKIKARQVAKELSNLIDESKNVYIMGHSNPDFDSFGASIGMYRIVKSRNKNAYIVLKNIPNSIKGIFNNLREEKNGQLDYIMTPKEALLTLEKDSLCIVVDTHRYTHVESGELLEKCSRIAVIDHHRRGKEFIENPVLIYQETYASSASELVTELLEYTVEEKKLRKSEAEALMSGIKLDTKNFSVNTGVRTFEAAAFLKKNGADSEVVRKLFRGNIGDLKLKSQIISNSKIINRNIAISSIDENNKNIMIISAQSADELLNVENVKASFVIYKIGKEVYISGRSTGDINVQIIMESFNGGGHINSAGGKVFGKTVYEVESELEKEIYKYLRKDVVK